MSGFGRFVEPCFVNARPDGMLTADVFNWMCHGPRILRTRTVAALVRSEIIHTGLCIQARKRDGRPLACVGDAETLSADLRQHASSKDGWAAAARLTTRADQLHKAHVTYLASRRVEIARDVGPVSRENENIPQRSWLSEAAHACKKRFRQTLSAVVDLFVRKARFARPVQEVGKDGTFFSMTTERHGCEAHARLENGELVVLADSCGRIDFATNSNFACQRLHAGLYESDTLAEHDGPAVFTRDFVVSSPSAAAAMMQGRSANGRHDWRHDETGKTWDEREMTRFDDGATE